MIKQNDSSSFNPRPCVRGDQLVIGNRFVGHLFQSTPLREGRLRGDTKDFEKAMFQSTPLREGRHNATLAFEPIGVFQSTPLREGRLGTAAFAAATSVVSIHAPA